MNIRIAIADGYDVFRNTFRILLEREPDFEVIAEATDGLAAVLMAEQHKPDVVLVDVSLPRLDGFEVTRVIASKFPQTKVIAITMYSDDGTRVKALEAGACYCFSKDGIFKGLLAVIRSCSPTHDATFS